MKRIFSGALALSLSCSVYSAEYIVKLSNQADSTLMTDLASKFEAKSVRSITKKIGAFYVVDSDKNLSELQSLAASHSQVEYIEPNYTSYQLFSAPSDARFSEQWGLSNQSGPDIEALGAWELSQGSEDFVVAVVDTGINYNHEDLKRNLWKNEAEANGTEGVDDDGNGVVDDIYGYNAFNDSGDPMDGHSHGSHCAGVIGADRNDIGIAGVMPKAKMMAIKIFSDNGRTSVEAIVRGIEYGINAGVKVMSNSWGGSQFSQAISDAVKAASDADILFIAAAGNGNRWGLGYDTDTNPVYPAGYEHDSVVSVGAYKDSGVITRFSNFGKVSVDVFAPGQAILSTITGNDYKHYSGTSMATPHVAGIAGLVLAAYPELKATEVKSRLIEGVIADPAYADKSVAGGTISALKALR